MAIRLLPHQVQALAWVRALASRGLGGVLSDDPGTGKVGEALSCPTGNSFFVVCPGKKRPFLDPLTRRTIGRSVLEHCILLGVATQICLTALFSLVLCSLFPICKCSRLPAFMNNRFRPPREGPSWQKEGTRYHMMIPLCIFLTRCTYLQPSRR